MMPKDIRDEWKAQAFARLPKRCRYKVIEQEWISPTGKPITVYHLWDNTRKRHASANTDYTNMINLAEMYMQLDKMLKEKT